MFAVPVGGSAAFLAPMPVGLVVETKTATLLQRLGIRRLGEFAALPVDDVLRRFGAVGAAAHERAAGREGARTSARTPPPEFDVETVFEPPLERVDQLAFAFRTRADEFVDRLRERRLVATSIRVELDDDRGGRSSRLWSHPRWFTAADVVDRVRWQLQGDGPADRGLGAAVVRVQVLPERVEGTGAHESGLWGGGPDERVHHGLTRVQSMLGHDAVVTPSLGGGRTLAERAVLVPWGDRAPESTADRPWPGSLPGLAPASVYRERVAVSLLDGGGAAVAVDERGALSGTPSRFVHRSSARAVRAWAGPWPLVERWWDAERARRLHRVQLVDDGGQAWLLLLDETGWWIEAEYD
ncbi:DNA polymerase Y family protein [Agromyces sp. MMS17-SY077]|uniref:DNA polymerase Y family protein n=1 Tax=Agromyces seonyuensis TaxID=2662446 RepID=A0A6I4P141_9MICO|nr:DNA polymerase Y family protein [Agromyces seonyuensis]